jgi:hypothetical protein
MSFFNPELEAKYRLLGFVSDGYGLKLKIGHVEIEAVEHPFNGVALFFSSITPRTATQFEIALPVVCTTEQIAGAIYLNFALNFREDSEGCRCHLQELKIPLFQ